MALTEKEELEMLELEEQERQRQQEKPAAENSEAPQPSFLDRASKYVGDYAKDSMTGQLEGAGLGMQKHFEPLVERGIAKGADLLGLNPGLNDRYNQMSNEQIFEPTRQMNEQAKERSPWGFGLGQVGGTVPSLVMAGGAPGASMTTRMSGYGGLGAIEKYARSNNPDQAERLLEAGETGAKTALGGEIAGTLLDRGVKAGFSAYDKLAPMAKSAFGKVRGISQETIDLYANPATRAKIDSIASEFDSLNLGQKENAIRVAGNIQNARANFVKDRLGTIDREIDSAMGRAQPVKIDSIMDSLTAGRNEILPVGGANKAGRQKISEIQQDILNLAGKNMNPIQRQSMLRKYGSLELPEQNPFAANSLESRETAKYIEPRSAQAEMVPRFSGHGHGTEGLSAVEYPMSDDLIPVTERSAASFITPKQANQLRMALNDEGKAAFRNQVGENLPGAEKVNQAANEVRSSLDLISPRIREENAKLSTLFDYEDSLKRGGLNQKEIDPNKLMEMLTAGPKMAAKESQGIEGLDQLLGTNLLEERSLARATSELNPQNPWSKVATGHSLYPIAVGGALSQIPVIGPVLGGTVAAVGTAAAAPALTKPIIRGAASFDSIVQGVKSGIYGKYGSVLQNAAAKGADALTATYYVLMQQDPEFRKTVNQSNSQEGK